MHSSVSLFGIMSCVHNPCVFYEVAIRLEQWFSNFFWSRTICVSRTVIMHHLAPEKVNVPNIIRSKV